MRTGTKSLLFGVHQFLWHPVTVWLAWVYLFRELPNWRECVCILIHDWGYWGKQNMDSLGGEDHPIWAARWALQYLDDPAIDWDPWSGELFDTRYHDLCLYHSRHFAKTAGKEPSKLCWADKCSVIFDPWWLYLPRAWLSGELDEYRRLSAARADGVPYAAPHLTWYRWLREILIKLGKSQRADAVEYNGIPDTKS